MIWSIKNLKGNRDAVKSQLAEAKDIPQSVKDFITSQIDSLPLGVSACKLDAHCQDVDNKQSMRMLRNINITLDGVQI